MLVRPSTPRCSLQGLQYGAILWARLSRYVPSSRVARFSSSPASTDNELTTADASLAPLLLTALNSISPLHALCPAEPTSPSIPRFRRALLLVLGISPYRTSSWSQSRIPNEGRFSIHVLSSVPALVVPVKTTAPVCAWSPWTVAQMLDASGTGMVGSGGVEAGGAGAAGATVGGSGGYDLQRHYYEILDFVNGIVDEDFMEPALRQGRWREKAAASVWGCIEAVRSWGALWRTGQMGKVIDTERAGIVMFRY